MYPLTKLYLLTIIYDDYDQVHKQDNTHIDLNMISWLTKSGTNFVNVFINEKKLRM